MRSDGALKTISITVILFVGCSPIYTSHDYDRGADFASYTTFSWLEIPEVEAQNETQSNPFLHKRVQDDIDKELAGKGLTKVADAGDLRVIYYVDAQQVTEISARSYGLGDMWVSSRVGAGDATVTDVTQGMIIVDLVDGKTQKLVWRGTAENAREDDASNEQIANTIDKAIKKVFEQYPPK
jgi:hypothetical protein